MKTDIKTYVKISKVDEDKRMVYGWASTPSIDADGEVIEVSALEKALPKYMQYPTIREMHQPKPAGTTKTAEITPKGLYIAAKIVADDAWKLVKEGVYSAFSIGGRVVQRVNNTIKELDLVEISLVDVPANKEARIELWKREKGVESPINAVQKSSYGIIRLVELLSATMYLCDTYEMEGKDATKLKEMKDQIKQLIIAEAKEKDREKGQKLIDTIVVPKTVDVQKRLESLKIMKFDNQIADVIRKGVIAFMQSIKKDDDTQPKTEEVVETAVAEEPKTEEKPEETVEETPDKPAEGSDADTQEEPKEEEKPEETVEAGDKVSAALKKVDAVTTKVTGKPATVKVEDQMTKLAKSVDGIAAGLAKIADALVSMESRLSAVESTPAAVKSRSVAVAKTVGGSDQTVAPAQPELQKHLDRIDELKKLRDELGAYEFAKQGYSVEAMTLEEKIRKIKAKTV